MLQPFKWLLLDRGTRRGRKRDVICCFPFDFELVNCDDAVGGRRLLWENCGVESNNFRDNFFFFHSFGIAYQCSGRQFQVAFL